jgi:hypothetical protein
MLRRSHIFTARLSGPLAAGKHEDERLGMQAAYFDTNRQAGHRVARRSSCAPGGLFATVSLVM